MTIRAKIAQHLRAKRIPKEVRDNYCTHCGRPKKLCACSTRYCPKCKRETMHHDVRVGEVEAKPGTMVRKSMIGSMIYEWRCHECDDLHPDEGTV
jgi:DTW domain-containing protein YfiP